MSAEMPTASPVDSKTVEPVEMDAVLATLKTLEAADLFKVMKQALAAAEKRSTGSAPRGRAAAAKKTGSMPKGVVPPQLRKPRAWVDFTLQHALENGWEPFTVYQTKKDKESGEKIEEEIEMPGSILHDGAYVYEGSVTEKTPAGKQLIHKDAMSLSKQRWAPKDKKGTHEELYNEFLASYVEDEAPAADDASETSSTKKVVVRKTAAEKVAEAEAKKAAKEAEKAEKKAAKEAEKAEKKAEKDAEKAAKKAEKEAEKAAKKAEKEAAKKPAAKAPVPAAAVKKAAATPVKATATPVKAAAAPVKAPVKKAAVAAPKKEEWSCPADGMVHPWPYKGKTYLRNSDNEVWLRGADGGCGEWQGVYLPAEDRIDDSVSEPVFEDEE
jgi:DNA polymerase III gamma/tau subunit